MSKRTRVDGVGGAPAASRAYGGPAAGLLDVLGAVEREVALGDLLRSLVRRVARTLDADRGTLYLVDRARQELVSIAADLPEISEIRLRLDEGVAGHVATTGEIVNAPTSHADARFFDGIDERTGYTTRSILAVPMRGEDGEILGVLQLLNKASGAFDATDARGLSALAIQASAVVQATTLYPATARPAADCPEALAVEDRFNRILGESPPMQAAYRVVRRAAPSEVNLLLLGETGTGKELFARAIHVNSGRSARPLVKVDCAALPATLVENELFGHERGAFTGADRTVHGKVDEADGGTLFLDEIGELPLAAQGKLLRLLQDRVFSRVGGTASVPADVRVVAATHRDLEAMVRDGAFRADLYYRLKVVTVRLPPLRERGEADLRRLVWHFLSEAARRHRRPLLTPSEAAWQRLLAHRWPGNVRELENCLESAVVLAEATEIRADDLPLPAWVGTRAGGATGPADPSGEATPTMGILDPAAATPRTLEAVERDHVRHVLEFAAGNRTRAAEILGIGRNTLTRKLKAWGET
jgi:Nif-specific regulatory protein